MGQFFNKNDSPKYRLVVKHLSN
uniref:Uncharacterized protein n=1 Tax=Rhizophora mucronata TaxID=61149 RepID=A0A2P2J0U4_RHIMU